MMLFILGKSLRLSYFNLKTITTLWTLSSFLSKITIFLKFKTEEQITNNQYIKS